MNEALWLYCRLLLLLMVANGVPIILQWLFKERWSWPVDGGRTLSLDGKPWLGRSKTWRGLVAAIPATGLAAVYVGLPFSTGFVAGAWAMAGDLLASFIKRRLNLAPSDRAPGLDQVPESLLPLWAIAGGLRLETSTIAWLVVAFIVLEMSLSPFLYALHIRERPY